MIRKYWKRVAVITGIIAYLISRTVLVEHPERQFTEYLDIPKSKLSNNLIFPTPIIRRASPESLLLEIRNPALDSVEYPDSTWNVLIKSRDEEISLPMSVFASSGKILRLGPGEVSTAYQLPSFFLKSAPLTVNIYYHDELSTIGGSKEFFRN